MKELTIEHLEPYLPYGLKAKNCLDQIVEIKGLQYGNDAVSNELWTFREAKHGNYMTGYLYECKPVLKSMSLYNECMTIGDMKKEFNCSHEVAVEIAMFEDDKLNELSYAAYKVMCENHIDFNGLIEKGLAISYNTLNETK